MERVSGLLMYRTVNQVLASVVRIVEVGAGRPAGTRKTHTMGTAADNQVGTSGPFAWGGPGRGVQGRVSC